ncbi:MAG: sulfur carrier protein ThiS adenylyltransferase ThiF [Candidatus Cloacimonetes bacterium]|jgi:sulfur carrier protein ThiS adenylyltransferase|nr:sulfur carrier protein ThiS adenylyltransferase ThiF [Candidatus Cloacimonadota bacterium]MDY0298340.1 sulfur carrier protein ThiS adenylyltransferase ThiF [Candidatus Cloacimonadaceae bacterium]MCB5278049.1 sulfur carrier protein ThiS adenylyltransferase ThiF [Candidatus Cloacimonadota bacterium]MCK9331615.1 sulfur carrier protein ThiS adenylyltransferase ThiF [Candidatus Cloacimonadota bacterium]MDD2209920.1 sulfur carrier protein ThiS adenylyltransferase ThiF [Candidatus Cloacimonadota ba
MNRSEYFCNRDPHAFPLWQKSCVGIAGAGGLGSNIAILLSRVGIGKLIISDFDQVSISNLNRQAFTLNQVGKNKVDALQANIGDINPYIELETHFCRLTPQNIPLIHNSCDIIIEALDAAGEKLMLIETCLHNFPQTPLICASGLAGYGNSEAISIIKQDALYVVGDHCSELKDNISPIAPRVMLVAAMMANLCLELLAPPKKTLL